MKNKILDFFLIGLFSSISICATGQISKILDFQTKDLSGNVEVLKDRLDPTKNYLFETMAFWCAPCVRSINKFNYQQNYWRERFNLDIILIEDEHWDDLEYVSSRMQSNGWDLNIVMTEDLFHTVGINSIPRYYFLQAGIDTLERIPSTIEQFLIGRLDSIFFKPVLENDFTQVILNEDCSISEVYSYLSTGDTIINNQEYFKSNSFILREDEQNGNLISYDPELQNENIYLKYSAPICSKIELRDFEGDVLTVKIMDIFASDSIIHLVTDHYLSNSCGEDSVAFELIQGLGTNAGFWFDIRDDKIVSRLVCHQLSGELIYLDEEFEDHCGLSTSTDELDSSGIRIFPNPASDFIQVETNIEGEKEINLYASDGRLLESILTSNRLVTIPIDDESISALIFLTISSQEFFYSKKIVKIKQ